MVRCQKTVRRLFLERISLSINNNDAYAVSNPDMDPQETSEWLESLSQASATRGRGRARELMLNLLRRSHELQLNVPLVPTTDYINTISPEDEPAFPGDEKIERTYRSWMRWNAAMLVHRAQRPGIAVGGHISTFASSASLYEVGFNHFFKGQDHPSGGDQIFIQGHASPGPYARDRKSVV
jgi:pyruvate dehydrogenase E1 component